MSPGERMVRVDDGMRGVVELVEGEHRIVYVDRGERLIAPKREKWAAEETRRPPMRPEEIREVAISADRVLRALDRHEPSRWWEPVRLDAPVYDQGLVQVITDYLENR